MIRAAITLEVRSEQIYIKYSNFYHLYFYFCSSDACKNVFSVTDAVAKSRIYEWCKNTNQTRVRYHNIHTSAKEDVAAVVPE